MSAPLLSSSAALADDNVKGDSTAFHRTEMPRDVYRPTSASDAIPVKRTNLNAAALSQGGSSEASSNGQRERSVHGVRRPTSTFLPTDMPSLITSAADAHSEVHTQHQHHPRGSTSAQQAHPYSQTPAIHQGDVPPLRVQFRPTSPSASASSLNSSTHAQSSSVTSSQYLYAIQQDLEAIVQLQQQQLLSRVERDIQQQQTQQQMVSGTRTQKSEVQLKSIDSVKQAFIQDAAHFLPPPLMPGTAPASEPANLAASATAKGRNRKYETVDNGCDGTAYAATTDVIPHDSSSTSLLLRHHDSKHKNGSSNNSDNSNNQDAGQPAHISALPPPPPSSSPIPASLVEYHAYLMQLEHQQQQHYEVLRRQRKLQEAKAKEEAAAMQRQQQQQQRHRSPFKGNGGAASMTPPRQRIGTAAAFGVSVDDNVTAHTRRDRSPPLALMLRTIRHRGEALLGNTVTDAAATYNIYHRWSDAYTDDEEEEEEGGNRWDSDKIPGRQKRTPSTARQTSSQRGSVNPSARRAHRPSGNCDDDGMDRNRNQLSTCSNWKASSSQRHQLTPGQTALPLSSTRHARHETPQMQSADRLRMRSPESTMEEENQATRTHSGNAHRFSFGGVQEQQDERANAFQNADRCSEQVNLVEETKREPRKRQPRSRRRSLARLNITASQKTRNQQQQRALLGSERSDSDNDSNNGPPALQPSHTPPSAPQYTRQSPTVAPQPCNKLANNTTRTSDDVVTNQPEVSPIKPTLSLLEHDLGGLSSLNNFYAFRLTPPPTASQTSPSTAAAAAANTGRRGAANLIGVTPSSSSPVEAFADALLLDNSSSPSGGVQPPRKEQQHQQVTAASLAAVTPTTSAVHPHSRMMLPYTTCHTSIPCMLTPTVATPTVGGTATLHEPIAFSIAAGGVVVPIIGEQQGSSSSSGGGKLFNDIAATASTLKTQQQCLKEVLILGNQRNLNAVDGTVADASVNTASTSRSPDKIGNGADTTAVGQAATTAADATIRINNQPSPQCRWNDEEKYVPHAESDENNVQQREHVPCRHRSPGMPAEADMKQRSLFFDETSGGDGFVFPSHLGPYTSFGGQPEHKHQQNQHYHYRHHHRRSYEGTSSMIPEHGTGTPRSSRYRNNSTGTGGGSHCQQRQQHGVCTWSAKYDTLEDELEAEKERTASLSMPNKNSTELPPFSEKATNGEHTDIQDALAKPRAHVLRHRSGAEHQAVIITTDPASGKTLGSTNLMDEALKKKGERALRNRKHEVLDATVAGATDAHRSTTTRVHKAHHMVENTKPPWRSARALVSSASRQRTAATAAAASQSPDHAHHDSGAVTTVADDAAAENGKPSAAAVTEVEASSHPHPSRLHHSVRSPNVGAVWHEVKSMWTPAPAPHCPFAPAFRYYPHSLMASMQDGSPVSVTSLLSLRLPLARQPQPQTHKGLQPSKMQQKPPAIEVNVSGTETKQSPLVDGRKVDSVDSSAVVTAAVSTTAARPLSPASQTGNESAAAMPLPPSPLSSPYKMRSVPHKRTRNAQQQCTHVRPLASLTAPAIPQFYMTDSLIGAALQDVLPVCKARQREVAREVDRQRYQLMSVGPSAIV